MSAPDTFHYVYTLLQGRQRGARAARRKMRAGLMRRCLAALRAATLPRTPNLLTLPRRTGRCLERSQTPGSTWRARWPGCTAAVLLQLASCACLATEELARRSSTDRASHSAHSKGLYLEHTSSAKLHLPMFQKWRGYAAVAH